MNETIATRPFCTPLVEGCVVLSDMSNEILLPSQAFFLLGSILNLPGLKFYLLYCEQGKTRPHDRAASELGKQGIFFPSMLQTRKTRNFFS